MNFKTTYLYIALSFIWLATMPAISFGREASPSKPPYRNMGLGLPGDCRDTTVVHTEKVAFLMVVNFNASTFRWRTGYRKWSTVEKVGDCRSVPNPPVRPTPSYTYFFSNNKTQVKQDIVDFRVLKP
ncbi:MAG: hypothetical protein V4594_16315 [Bacteroidota bacterium]